MLAPGFEWFVAWRHLRDPERRSRRTLLVGLAALAAGGLCLVAAALVPHLTVARELETGELVRIPVKELEVRRVLRMVHEDVVDDLEGSVRRMLEYCGLEFEPQCVEFHKTQRSVRTASSEQVRRPLYREGLDQWKSFEPWLGPLKEALGDARDRWRDE